MTVAFVAVATLLAACGGSTDTGSNGDASGPTAATGATGGTISTAKASGVGTVLVDADGFTLYCLETDADREVTCTGGCAEAWPPLIVTEVPDASGLPGELDTIANPTGGTQLTYEGWPLYTYAGDTEPGQANGEGVGGVWFAMTPDGPGGGGDTGGKY